MSRCRSAVLDFGLERLNQAPQLLLALFVGFVRIGRVVLAEPRVLYAGLVFLRDLHSVESGTEKNDFRLLIFHGCHLLSDRFV